jgi:hypothetical protein
MGVSVPIVLDEDPPEAVGCHSQIGLELVLLKPVFDLAETVFRLIEAFVDRLSFDQQSVGVDVSRTPSERPHSRPAGRADRRGFLGENVG